MRGVVAAMWFRASLRIFPRDLVTHPRAVLDVGKLYHTTVMETVRSLRRLGHVPAPGHDAQYIESLWRDVQQHFLVQGEGADAFVQYVRRVFNDAVKDTMTTLRSFPASTHVIADILPSMFDECLAWLNRAAVVSAGAPMPPLLLSIRR